jgi:hypothetical protein
MEHFLSYSGNSDNFADKITINKYTQGENETKVNTNVLKSKNILEIVLSQKDYNYQILDNKEKSNFIIKKSLELSSFLDLNYGNYNYNKKKYSKSMVCGALQGVNNLSSILFYNDYYNVNIVICNEVNSILKFYKTGIKNYPEYLFIKYDNNQFTHMDQESIENNFSSVMELSGDVKDPKYTLKDVINMDIKDNMIYNLFLKAISNYKLDDIVIVAKENNIDLMSNGKKKNKKTLYDEINLMKL